MCLLLGADMCWIYCCTCTTDVDLIKIELLCPFLSVLLPQISLWQLKSPIIMKGLGSCFIKLFISDSLGSSFGGIYTEHSYCFVEGCRYSDCLHVCIQSNFALRDVVVNDYWWSTTRSTSVLFNIVAQVMVFNVDSGGVLRWVSWRLFLSISFN